MMAVTNRKQIEKLIYDTYDDPLMPWIRRVLTAENTEPCLDR